MEFKNRMKRVTEAEFIAFLDRHPEAEKHVFAIAEPPVETFYKDGDLIATRQIDDVFGFPTVYRIRDEVL